MSTADESKTTERPDYVSDEHLEYLDSVRESGSINMFGAAPIIAREFLVDKKRAREILSYWMQSFGKNDR